MWVYFLLDLLRDSFYHLVSTYEHVHIDRQPNKPKEVDKDKVNLVETEVPKRRRSQTKTNYVYELVSNLEHKNPNTKETEAEKETDREERQVEHVL